MDILSSFSTDENLELNGKVFPLSKTASVLVARSGNDNYVAMLRKQMQEAQLDLTSGEEADRLAEVILIDVMAKTVLLGWKGLTEGGVEVPYSVDKAKEYLRVKDFRKKINALADNFESFKRQADVQQKNA